MKKTLSVFSALFFGLLLAIVLVIFTYGEKIQAKQAPLPCDIEDSFAKNEILSLCADGIFDAASDGQTAYFFPKEPVTRAYFAKSLVRLLGVDASRYEKAVPLFADGDDAGAGYLPYVNAAVSLGVMPLYDENGVYYFFPQTLLSREEAGYLASVLTNAQTATTKTDAFSDFDQTDPLFIDGMAKAVALDILIGYDDGTIRPRQVLSREELALMLYRIKESRDFGKNGGLGSIK